MSDIEKPNITELENDKPNREYKDSIFVDLLTYKEENLRQVCQALGESTQNEPIELLQMKNTAYTGLKNDVSFLIGKKLLMLIEHQSTINRL